MKLNKDYFYCFSCGAHGDVINLVQQIYGLSAIEAAQKICNDFNLNSSTDTCKSPSIIKQRQQEIEHRKALERAFLQARRDALFILHGYHSLLLSWKRDLVPTDMDLDNANPLFHEALNSFDRMDSMINDLIYGSTKEQIEFLKFYDKEIKILKDELKNLKPQDAKALADFLESNGYKIAPVETPSRDWTDSFEYDIKGNIKQTNNNCKLAIENDPLLKGAIKKNELSGSIDVVKDLGWKRHSTSFTDTDLDNIILYLEKNYDLHMDRMIDRAVKVVANQNSYNPIKELLDSLK